MANILYLSYDGMTDALGESQVLSYLIGLAENNKITLISFEKKEAFQLRGNRIEELCKNANIQWHKINYTSKPPILSTIFDIYKLKKIVKNINNYNIIHCRGYITSIIGLAIKRKKNIPFIFDMRGFWADEKLESGNWASILFRPIYMYFKLKETQFFNESSLIISLTEAGKKEIISSFHIPESKIKTIPTCVNQAVFKSFDKSIKNNIKHELGIYENEKVMVYSGSLGGNYDINILINSYQFFIKTHPQSKLLILTKTLEATFPKLEKEISKNIIMKSVDYNQVSDYLMIADLGFVFYKHGFSNIGRYPTKLAEYWSCGVPCLVHHEIGDTKPLLDKYPSYGFYYFSDNELNTKMKSFNFNPNKIEMRNVAEVEFSLNNGVAFYNNIYQQLV